MLIAFQSNNNEMLQTFRKVQVIDKSLLYYPYIAKAVISQSRVSKSNKQRKPDQVKDRSTHTQRHFN